MMRVLMLHSSHRSRGGEDESFLQEAALLREHGHDVMAIDRPASAASAATMAGEALGLSLDPIDRLEDALNNFKPHVCHVQAYARWGPASFKLLRRRGVPVIQAVRNWRIAGCPAGTFFRDGAVCTECAGRRFAWPAIEHACFHGPAGSAVAALSMKRYDWSGVHFLAVSEAIKRGMVEAGFEVDRISVKPNTCADPGVGDGSGGYALFVGAPDMRRPEKGFDLLVVAWAVSGLPRDKLEVAHGMPHAEVLDLMKRAALVVVPSTWHDPLPRVVIEAFACGTPVLATRMGGLPEIIADGVTGWLVEPIVDDGRRHDPVEALADGLERAFDEAPRLRQNARLAYEARFTPGRNHELLMQSYSRAMAAKLGEREAMEAVA